MVQLWGYKLEKSLVEKLREKYHHLRYKQAKRMLYQEGRKLLDIGCGRPFNSMKDGSFLRYIGYGTGIDVMDCNIEFPFKKASSNDIPFRNNYFGVVVALETLEHLSDLKGTFKEVRRVLKPNGIFLVSVPNNSFLWRIIWFLWEKTIGKEWIKTHTVKYKKTQWLRLLSKYFKIEESTNFMHLLSVVKMKNIK